MNFLLKKGNTVMASLFETEKLNNLLKKYDMMVAHY